MIHLEPMNKADYLLMIDHAIKHYAYEIKAYGAAQGNNNAEKMSEKTITDLLSDGFATKNHCFYSIFYGQTKIGYLWVKLTPPNIATICGFFIDEEYRGKGYGDEALKLLETHLKKRKYTKFILGVFKANNIAVSLYRKNGYCIETIVALSPGDSPTKYRMTKELCDVYEQQN